jgi:hypothetical protein
MTTVSIGDLEADLPHATAGWIRDHVRALRSRRMPVCVQVAIQSGQINIVLSTPACACSTRSSWEPNSEEQKIVDLWRKRGLSADDFDIGQLIAFTNEIKHLV